MDPQHPSKPLIIKSLTRTPIESVSVLDIKDIFSALICKLNLIDDSHVKKQSIMKLTLLSKKKYPYSFTVKRAIEVLRDLSIDIKHGSTLTKISYETKPKFAFELLQLFFSSKLVHCPDDKTLDTLGSSSSSLLQPTPKGVAILHWFCQRIGISQMMDFNLPDILKSNFNSMELITFERDSRSDSIIHNEYSDKLIFLQIMGPKMNIWSNHSPPDDIKRLGDYFNNNNSADGVKNIINPSLALTNEDAFFEYLRNRQHELVEKEANASSDTKINQQQNQHQKQLQNTADPNKSNFNNENEVSPFYHKFFTNPDSDSHIQYYTSNIGLRFFKSKSLIVDGKNIQINNCFSGKAIVQYLMDCTDLMYHKEGIKVASFFFKHELIECPSSPNSIEFKSSKDTIYKLTQKGLDLVKWGNQATQTKEKMSIFIKSNSNFNSPIKEPTSSEGSDEGSDDEFGMPKPIDFSKLEHLSEELSLNQILKDPGLKYLLRQFMITNVCDENLNAYDDIIEFQRRMNILKKLLSLKDKAKEKYLKRAEVQELIQDKLDSKKILVTFRAAIKRLSEISLIKVYNIYAMYLSDNAPNELNIDFNLRSSVHKLITNESNMNLIQSSTSLLFSDFDLGNPKYPQSPIIGPTGGWTRRINEEENIKRDVTSQTITETSGSDSFTDGSAGLTLKLKNTQFKEGSPSPTDIVLGPTLMFLDDVNVYYDEIKIKVVKMMETDSLSKFLNSDQFNELKVSLPK